MMNAIVVDDEWYISEEIGDMAEGTGLIHVIKKYNNPLKVLEELLDTLPDIAFIDIEMPEIDGITLAERLLEIKPDLIITFITSWNKYAVQAFEINAIDYIMKPINTERFGQMVEKIKDRYDMKRMLFSKSLKIKSFGCLESSIGDIPIKWERSKAEELFAFLLMNHNNYIGKDIIIDNLWPDYEPQKALQILQTSVCRIRNVFSEQKNTITLDYNRSRYCLSISNAECDLLEVEEALSNYNRQDDNSIFQVEKAFLKYEQGFLEQQGYLWSIQKNEELRKNFIIVINDIVQKYISDQSEESRRFLKYLTVLEPFNDGANYHLLMTYINNGHDNEALNHYQWLKNILKEEYDTVPSEKINQLYRTYLV
jgi:two-component system LytT family response regulator